MDSKDQKEPAQQSQEEQKLSEMPKIDNYLHPLTPSSVAALEPKLECIFSTMKNKLEQSKPSLFIKPSEFSLSKDDYKQFFNFATELNKEQYNIIIDCLNFIHYVKNEEELKELKDVRTLNQEYLNSLFNAVKDKGTLVLLLDFQYAKQVTEALKKTLGDKYMTKLFIKLYVIEKLPLLCVLSIQKMSVAKEAINIDNEKLLLYEIYEDLTITKPESYTMNTIPKSLTYMYEMYQYQGYLSELHPGVSLPIKIKENFYSDNIECTFTIADSNEPELMAKKNCVAIIVSKNYSNDFIYLTVEGNLALCRQVQASRIILIRPAPFNFDSTHEIKNKMSSYILLFKFRDCVNESIPVMLMSDENNESYEIMRNEDVIVRDIVENEKKETFRQLIFTTSPTEVQSEIKLRLTSKAKIKNSKDIKYITLPTAEKFSSKNLVSCFDDEFLSMFYIKTLLSGILFLNIETYPKEPLKILVLGAGIGTINYFFDKILKSNVQIDAVELSKKITKIGKDYFGMNNYDNEKKNIKWHFEDAHKYILNEKKENYYDMIIMDINNTNHVEGISPPPCFFEENVLKNIHTALKPTGMYIVNLMARSYKNYLGAFDVLEKTFPLLFMVENNEDLNKIHFCFKTKMTNDQYLDLYKVNLLKLTTGDCADITLIKEDYKRILKRIADTEKFKTNMETYVQ